MSFRIWRDVHWVKYDFGQRIPEQLLYQVIQARNLVRPQCQTGVIHTLFSSLRLDLDVHAHITGDLHRYRLPLPGGFGLLIGRLPSFPRGSFERPLQIPD